MKTVTELAREAWQLEFIPESDTPKLQRFHDLAIAQYREGLLAGVGEAVNVPACTLGACKNRRDVCDPAQHCMNTASYYTADQMAAARAALQAEVDRMGAELAGVEAVNKAAALEIVSLRAELEAAKADAARYRAIREGLEVDKHNIGAAEIVVSLVDDFGGETLRGEQADAAIDNAMKGQP